MSTWVTMWDLREHPRSLAIVRIFVGAIVAWDLATVLWLDLPVTLWGATEAGGLGNPMAKEPPPWIYTVFSPSAAVSRAATWTALGCSLLLALGVYPRFAAFVLVAIYAALARTFGPTDRGIDMLLRNVLLILGCSGCGAAFALLPSRRPLVPAWPRHLIALQVAGMYFSAGIQKAAVAWMPWGGFSALYVVLQDPAVARIPFDWLRTIYPVTQAMTLATIVFEYTACLVPLAFWYRFTRCRPGWLRAQANRTRIHVWWLAMGVLLHVGIALTLRLGIFPWAMLALYPAFIHPDEWRTWWKAGAPEREVRRAPARA